MKKEFDILAIGEPLYELALQGDGTFLSGFGGDTSNCAIAATRHGAKAAYMTIVGSDYFGDALIDLWRKEGVDATSVKRHQSAPTGIYFVFRKPGGHEFVYRRQGSAASMMGPSDVPSDLIKSSKVLHVSGISQAISASAEACVLEAVRLAKANGVLVSYDPNYRAKLWSLEKAKAVISRTMASADIVLPSIDDMQALFGVKTPSDAIDLCLGLGAKIMAMTLGREGSIVADAKSRATFPALAVEPIDTTGAGDAFDGAFLTEFLRSQDLMLAGRYATIAASLSTLRLGAVAGLPTRAQTVARL